MFPSPRKTPVAAWLLLDAVVARHFSTGLSVICLPTHQCVSETETGILKGGVNFLVRSFLIKRGNLLTFFLTKRGNLCKP